MVAATLLLDAISRKAAGVGAGFVKAWRPRELAPRRNRGHTAGPATCTREAVMVTTVPSTSIPLTAEDRAILRLESPKVVGHTAKVVHLGAAAPDAAGLRARVARRLPSAPQLSWRLDGPAAAAVWRPVAVDLHAHVGEMVATQPLDTERLRVEVARLFHESLDRSRPLWRMDLVGPLADGGTALVWRVHHALADGATILRLARAVLWDATLDPVPTAHPEPGDVVVAEVGAGQSKQCRHELSFLAKDQVALCLTVEHPRPGEALEGLHPTSTCKGC
jgi:hypothetical protein